MWVFVLQVLPLLCHQYQIMMIPTNHHLIQQHYFIQKNINGDKTILHQILLVHPTIWDERLYDYLSVLYYIMRLMTKRMKILTIAIVTVNSTLNFMIKFNQLQYEKIIMDVQFYPKSYLEVSVIRESMQLVYLDFVRQRWMVQLGYLTMDLRHLMQISCSGVKSVLYLMIKIIRILKIQTVMT